VTRYSDQQWYDAEGEARFGNPHGSPLSWRTVEAAEQNAREHLTSGVLRFDIVECGPTGGAFLNTRRVVKTVANPDYRA
jgi:hypothetical protein